MAIKPILFNMPMVQAILAGRKTETRRIVKPQPDKDLIFAGWPVPGTKDQTCLWCANPDHLDFSNGHHVNMPVTIGDILWVRETFFELGQSVENVGASMEGYLGYEWWSAKYPWYAADGEPPVMGKNKWGAEEGIYPKGDNFHPACQDYFWRKRPSIHMPKWAARIFLRVTGLKVARLSSMSKEDAKAEGLSVLTKDGGRTYKYGIADQDGWPGNGNPGWPWGCWEENPRRAFAKLWNSTTDKPEYRWGANPWVWVVRFERTDRPKEWPNGN